MKIESRARTSCSNIQKIITPKPSGFSVEESLQRYFCWNENRKILKKEQPASQLTTVRTPENPFDKMRKCEVCYKMTSRRCSFCSRDFYCSEPCQNQSSWKFACCLTNAKVDISSYTGLRSICFEWSVCASKSCCLLFSTCTVVPKCE